MNAKIPDQNEGRWLLPEGIEELLPAQAGQLERLRRQLLDCYSSWGYELVMPPFVEYLESLLTGTGKELDLQTFRITDSITGRQMGLRADMTPQAARIDAHQLKRDVPARLCYLGTVLRTRQDGFAGSRAPLQVGAELYGHAGVESDLEILQLLLETLRITGIEHVHLDLGHVGIFRNLARQADLTAEQENSLFDALQRKAIPEIEVLLKEYGLQKDIQQMFSALATLHGDESILDRALEVLNAAGPEVKHAIETLKVLVARLRKLRPECALHVDLAELRGYAYQTGVVFAAFVPGYGQEIARGGRYDEIGSTFGRARPATGFSADLKTLVTVSSVGMTGEMSSAIFAPAVEDEALQHAVAQLRAEGERVVCELPGQEGNAREQGCDRVLELHGDSWQVVTPG
jgi:ATP phosphoribosyltransferase regulatory subunit